MLSTNDLEARIEELPTNSDIVRKEGETLEQIQARRAKAKRERKLAVSIFEGEWQAWLGAEYASHLPHAAQEEVFALAWEQGHHAGYSEVEDLYEKYADFATKVRAA